MAKKQNNNQATQAKVIDRKDQKEKRNFFQKTYFWFKEKPLRWIAVIVLIAAVFLYSFLVNRTKESLEQSFQTAKLEKGDLIAIVGATGIVEAKQTAVLEWQSTGRVEDVNVKINDQVSKGDILAKLAANTLPQEVILAQADLVDAQRALDDLINSDTASAEAYANLLQAERELRDARDDRNQWNYNNTNYNRINEARDKFIAAEEELKIQKKIFEEFTSLAADDPKRVEAKKKLDEYQLARDKALRTLNYILGKAYGQQVAEDFADYDVAIAELADAQREWDRLKNGTNADDIKAAEAKVAAAEATVSMGWLEAPFDGTITQAEPKPGDLIASGDLGFRIDDLSRLFVKVDISEVDINRIQVGQNAELVFDAIPTKTYPAKVTEVAAIGNDTGEGVDFTITLQIIEPDEQVRPGMTAAVNIIVSEVKDVLMLPTRAIRLKEGKRIVYILKDGALKEIPIDVGASSDTHTEITSENLQAGDLIVLNPPFEFITNGGQPAFTR